MQRIVMLLDMDYFFAQVEEREKPELKEKPLMVCIFSGRGEMGGVVSTCNYAARALGVRSGVPIAFAKRKAPQGVFLKADFGKYEAASAAIMHIIAKHAKTIEQASIDEAYAELTKEAGGSFPKAEEIAQKIKTEILQTVKLTCSVGIGENKLVAKMASDAKKPNGLTVVKPGEVAGFLNPMMVGKLFGVGKKTEEKLNALGVKTIGELAKMDLQFLIENLGSSFGRYLFEASKGKDDGPVKQRGEAVQISRIATFPKDTADKKEIAKFVEQLAESVFERVKEGGVEFRQVTFIAILDDLQAHTKSRTLEKHAADAQTLEKNAVGLADEFDLKGKKLRRAGVRAGMLQKKKENEENAGKTGKKAKKIGENWGKAKRSGEKGKEAEEEDAAQKSLFDF